MAGLGIQLTPEEQKEIARKQAIVSLLNSSGALDVYGNSITIHFDADGNVRKIDRVVTLLRT